MAVTVALAGDTMLGRGVADEIAASGPNGLFSDDVREIFSGADLGLVNLECCVSGRGRKWDAPGKPFHFRAPPAAAEALAGLGVDCVTLANNHALDYGPEALADTLRHLGGAGIQVVGAGASPEEARECVVLEAGGLRIAVVGVTDHPVDFAAGHGRPGVAHAELEKGVPGYLVEQIRRLRESDDVVLVLAHWGPNMTREPLPYVRRAAGELVDAGATLVAGSSAHVFHGVALPVIFDMGDFIDDYAVDGRLRNDLGLLFLVTLDGAGPSRVEAVPLRLAYSHTHLADDAGHAWIAERFTRACAAFGTSVKAEGGRLVVEAPP
ncbi:CapA family protein [Actinomadura sp. 7K507]|uniref:CapA family protein n=1 Tax=Actinomadura sp. 7K507 TaxID=2530365 RepID=UPI00104DD483|nr:CapA family protein [Actinomadura sp. 7K507]TDC85014.1 CapA family protein [Actinomadura sp. 7K507]